MKRLILIVLAVIGSLFSFAQERSFTEILANFNKRGAAERTLVVAHRGDWRNAPENSIQSLENVIRKGIDVYELDLKRSKDGHLILMHDRTIDRTVNAKGKPEDYTLAELKGMKLRNGLGRATPHQIPTFEEFLLQSKDRILVDVDKGFDYFLDVIKLVQKLGMENQVIINVDAGNTLQAVEQKFGSIPANIILMPIINLNKADYKKQIDSYRSRKNTVFQPVFKEENNEALAYIKQVQTEGYHIWLNALWPSLNAGHDDDTAVELNKKDETWGWLIKQGATMIQTDRPFELMDYIENKN